MDSCLAGLPKRSPCLHPCCNTPSLPPLLSPSLRPCDACLLSKQVACSLPARSTLCSLEARQRSSFLSVYCHTRSSHPSIPQCYHLIQLSARPDPCPSFPFLFNCLSLLLSSQLPIDRACQATAIVLVPVVPVSFVRSLPAKSTKCSLEARQRSSCGRVRAVAACARCCSVIVKMAWLRLLCEFNLHVQTPCTFERQVSKARVVYLGR